MADRFNLADLFATAAAAVPDRVAIKSDKGHLTYAELAERVERLAGGLAARGIGRGDTVGLYLLNGPEYIESFLGAAHAGATPFNVNYRYSEPELAYLFGNAGAAAIIHHAGFSGTMRALRPQLPKLRLTVVVDDGSAAETSGSEPYEALLAHPPGGRFERSEDDILLQYTGGTTGMPKGVMWPHRAFFFACLNGAGYYHPDGPCKTPGDIAARASGGYALSLFCTAPLMHGAAIWAALGALLCGQTLILDPLRKFDAEKIWDRAEREGANMIQIVGDAMAIPLRDALRANPGRWKLDHVVNFGSGGAVFSAAVKEDIKALLPNAGITDGLGASETGAQGMASPSTDGVMRLAVNENLAVITEGRRLAVPGETGFIARSGNIPVGYFGDPEKTAETFVEVGGRKWAVTGDAARLEADGTLTMFGRGSTCINTGGEKVFPEEVEEVLRGHPAIYDAVVAGQPDERWGERVVGVVSQRPGTQRPGTDELRAWLRGRLADYKAPKALIWVEEVRRSPAGKQDYTWARQVAATA